MAWSSAKAAGALRRQSVQEPTPSFIPIDNWDASVHRPQVNAAVLQQPVTSEQGLVGSFERGSTGEKASKASKHASSDPLRSPSGLFKPGRRSGVPAMPPTPVASLSQSVDLQASVKALAQQAKHEQAKQQQAASQAEAKLDKLKGLLQRELALQASIQSGSIRLTDNGARLADRLAALHRDIQKQEQLIKCANPRNSPAVHISRPSQGDIHHIVDSKQVQADGLNSEPAAAAADNMQKESSTMRESVDRQSKPGLIPGASSDEARRQLVQPNHSSVRRSDRASSQPEQQAQRTQRGSQTAQQSERCKTADQQGGRASALSIRGRGTARGRGRQSSDDLNRNGKRGRSSGSSTSQVLQKQRRLWMEQLTSDATQQASRAEEEAKAAEYQPSWTYQDEAGQPQGPLPLTALKEMLAKGEVKGSLMVHDEEAEVSIRLATLIANSLQTRPVIPPLHKPQAAPPEASGQIHQQPLERRSDIAQPSEVKIEQRSTTPPSFDSLVVSGAASDGYSPVNQPHAHHIKRSEFDMHMSQEPGWSPQLPLDKLEERFHNKHHSGHQHSTAHASHVQVPLMQHPNEASHAVAQTPTHDMQPLHAHTVPKVEQRLHSTADTNQLAAGTIKPAPQWQDGRPSSLPPVGEVYDPAAPALVVQWADLSQQQGTGGYGMPHEPNYTAQPQQLYGQHAMHLPQGSAAFASQQGMQSVAGMHDSSHATPQQLPGEPPLPPEPSSNPARPDQHGSAQYSQVASTPATFQSGSAGPHRAMQTAELSTHESSAPHTHSQHLVQQHASGQEDGNMAFQQPLLLEPPAVYQAQAHAQSQQAALPVAQPAQATLLQQQKQQIDTQGVTPAGLAAALALLQSNPQLLFPSTVLSPELSAALATGALGQSVHHTQPSSQPPLSANQGYSNQTGALLLQPQGMPAQTVGHGYDVTGSTTALQAGAASSSSAAPPLPPELSAALAFGQLLMPLQPTAGMHPSEAPAGMQLNQAPGDVLLQHAPAHIHHAEQDSRSAQYAPHHAQIGSNSNWQAHHLQQHQHVYSQPVPNETPTAQLSIHSSLRQHEHHQPSAQTPHYRPSLTAGQASHADAQPGRKTQPPHHFHSNVQLQQEALAMPSNQQIGAMQPLPQHQEAGPHKHPFPEGQFQAQQAPAAGFHQISHQHPSEQSRHTRHNAAIASPQVQLSLHQAQAQLKPQAQPQALPRPVTLPAPELPQANTQHHSGHADRHSMPAQHQAQLPPTRQLSHDVTDRHHQLAQPQQQFQPAQPQMHQHNVHHDGLHLPRSPPHQHIYPDHQPEHHQLQYEGQHQQHHLDRQHQQSHPEGLHQQPHSDRQQHQHPRVDRQLSEQQSEGLQHQHPHFHRQQHQQPHPGRQHHQQSQPERQYHLPHTERQHQHHAFMDPQHAATAEPLPPAPAHHLPTPRHPVHQQPASRLYSPQPEQLHHARQSQGPAVMPDEHTYGHWSRPHEPAWENNYQDSASRSPLAGPVYADPQHANQAPMTAQEADLEWQHQLAEQDGPSGDDDWYEGGSMDADGHWREDEYAHADAYHLSNAPGMLAHQTGVALGHGQQSVTQGRRHRRARGGRRHRRSANALQSAHRRLPNHRNSSRLSAPPVPDRAQHHDRHSSERNSGPQHSSLQRQHRLASYADRSKSGSEHQAPHVQRTVHDDAHWEGRQMPRSRSPQRHGASATPAQQRNTADTRPHMQIHGHARPHDVAGSQAHKQPLTHNQRHSRPGHGPMLPRKASYASTLQQSGYPS